MSIKRTLTGTTNYPDTYVREPSNRINLEKKTLLTMVEKAQEAGKFSFIFSLSLGALISCLISLLTSSPRTQNLEILMWCLFSASMSMSIAFGFLWYAKKDALGKVKKEVESYPIDNLSGVAKENVMHIRRTLSGWPPKKG